MHLVGLTLTYLSKMHGHSNIKSWTNLFELLKLYTKKFDSYTLEMDDSNGATDNTQLIFFVVLIVPFMFTRSLLVCAG